MTLTTRERDLYNFIAAYIEKHGKSPSQPEMAKGLGCQQGYNTQRLVDGLEDAGYIHRERYKHRKIIITRYADGRKVPYKMCGGLVQNIPSHARIWSGSKRSRNCLPAPCCLLTIAVTLTPAVLPTT